MGYCATWHPIMTTLDGGDPADTFPVWRCPIQILGLDRDEHIPAPAGEDPFVALQHAIDLIGGLVDGGVERMRLTNRRRLAPDTRASWIGQFLD